MTEITFTIPGKPFAWRRARSNGRVRFKDADTVAHEATLQAIALHHFPAPLEGPLRLTVRACFAVPKLSAKKRAERLWRPHTARPDLDNLVKMIGDGWNRIAWLDDGQIAEVTATKLWADSDRTLIIVETL